jgi:hypothetical protein
VNRNGHRYCRLLEPFLHNSMTTTLRTAMKPWLSRIRQTSEPERTRSLPNRYLNLRYEDFAVKPPRDLRGIRSLEEQSKGLD